MAAQKAGPPCARCVYKNWRSKDREACHHPVFSTFRHDPYSGEVRGIDGGVTAKSARQEGGLCGPEALLFKPVNMENRFARWVLAVLGDAGPSFRRLR